MQRVLPVNRSPVSPKPATESPETALRNAHPSDPADDITEPFVYSSLPLDMPRHPLHPALQHCSRSVRRLLDACTLWRGTVDAQGYPRQKVKGVSKYAHRVLFELVYRKLRPGERVYRTCRNQRCVNALHLTTERPEPVGAARGERRRPGTAKLTPCRVRNVRAAWALAQGERPTQQELAKKYGVSRSCISLIVRGVTWSDV